MTYNFDPDRWYDDQRLRLDLRRQNGELSEDEYQAALAELDRRFDRMVKRLDGTFELHKNAFRQPRS